MELVDVSPIADSLTFDEMDMVEDLTGFSIEELPSKTGRYFRAMAFIALKRRGEDPSWNDLGKKKPEDVIDMDKLNEMVAEAEESNKENPTDASD